MATNPGETYQALKGLFTSGNILGNVSDTVKESYINRLNKLEEEYQRAGAGGSYKAGIETGKLLLDMAALATGVGGAAKAGIKVTEKAITKVANAAKKEVIEAGKAAEKGASIAGKGAGSSHSPVKPGTNFAPDANPNLTVNMNQQNKHLVGTNEHKTANASASTPRSTIDPNINVQKLVNDYAGTGREIPTGRALGTPGSKESISTNKVIGQYYDTKAETFVPTTNFTIHYSKRGVHIVPARPSL
ncbi:polymorphic toxin type 50 domain-containing protein [Snodgrassella sp. ESL0253]|uniref:polymorphic toxin type 50 domain-containing protein n=1 Tax=Snodgrassella sp. ESL0253 TaxID=2705031 RepID=UPI001581CED4|nr:polymorphic toxin type 50 domain-containing protein [Snodgrassella sp. ESL0253]NUE65639.1 hypothetical protein [Snodgrassella sp. ESL0253]